MINQVEAEQLRMENEDIAIRGQVLGNIRINGGRSR